MIVVFYIIATIIAFVLLSLPFVHKEGVEWNFIDVLFTAVSAVSVTGLTVVSTADTFNELGIVVLALVLQLGGVGVMALGTFIWIVMGRKISFQQRRLIMTDQNQYSVSGIVNLIIHILIIVLTIEVIGTIVLGTRFLAYFPTPEEAYLHGFFAAVSATTNAGFDITGTSLAPYHKDYFVQIVTMILIVLGSIGFPVLIEVKNYFVNSKKRSYRFSLFTKLTTSIFFILIIFGTIMILLLEWNHFFKNITWHETMFYALFQSVTTKSAGLTTMDVSQLTEPTLLLIGLLMFIGASPSSVGGGIRTTTFALTILNVYYYAKGHKTISIFGRELYTEDITKATAVAMLGVSLCFVSIMVLTITESFPLIDIVFEVCSAFGTTGLSLGITPELSTMGKIVIMILMFIGRVGLVTLLYLIGGREKAKRYRYPKEKLIIG
ncbi:TrkH family potassium uptake protein [Bacillus sp. 165]|uniref:TrkH family potassium uptake protein n=1 Tax=Bacillus sp. 165 TaxID=1529117 RepID=UPI001ADA51E5|nr:TrkH family potassium uptake protein [Bacillus sp. 165]MBO9128456.1 TrkH family potassium uptake protein [Bacillus sp. 165]